MTLRVSTLIGISTTAAASSTGSTVFLSSTLNWDAILTSLVAAAVAGIVSAIGTIAVALFLQRGKDDLIHHETKVVAAAAQIAEAAATIVASKTEVKPNGN